MNDFGRLLCFVKITDNQKTICTILDAISTILKSGFVNRLYWYPLCYKQYSIVLEIFDIWFLWNLDKILKLLSQIYKLLLQKFH